MKKNRNHEINFFDLIQIRAGFLIVFISAGFIQFTDAQSCSNDKEHKTTCAKVEKLMWEKDAAGIKNLVEADPGLVNMKLTNDETMLTIAAWTGQSELISYLVEKGADLSLRNKWNNTALHNAAQQGYTEIAKILLDKGADINLQGTSGCTSLLFAAQKQHPEMVALLLKHGAKVNIANDYEQTPIIAASWQGNPDVMSLLIQNGADIGFITENGNTILHNAAYIGNVACINLLIEKGADANKCDNEGKLPLHIALIEERTDAAALLMKSTENINLREKVLGNTPLHIAAINGNKELTEMLLNARADASVKNDAGLTPVEYATKYGYADIAESYGERKLASKQSVKTAAINKENALAIPGNEEAKVIYCGHSGWAVITKNHVLIFDYWNRIEKAPKGLASGSVNPEELKDKNVIVFVSHDHEDHYDNEIFGWADQITNIHYVYGFNAETSWVHEANGYHGPVYTFIPNNEQKEVGGVQVTTFPSTDSGQGFYVEADGITIYHPGDHAWFAEEDEAPFKKEVNFIASLNKETDIAFLPVTGCPSRWRKEFIVEGFLYNIDKLNPAQVYPMHALHREYTMKEFAELASSRKAQNQVICSEYTGDHYSYTKTVVAAK